MTRPAGRHGDHDGGHGPRARRVLRGLLPALLVLLLVPVILVLKVPTANTGTTPCDCETCHVSPHAGGFTGCTSCHGYPPATGSHRVHFDNNAPLDSLRYDDTTVRSTADAYIFGCGNCHPLDTANHMNGTVNVELYNASAPAESLKAKNPSTAAYNPTDHTCSNVYCHSGYTVASGPVGWPLQSPPNEVPPGYTLDGTYILDPTGNLTYAPYTVTITRDYKTTPAWGTAGTFTTCAECHSFPPKTSYPDVEAGVGDSHYWLEDYGYVELHAYNMGWGYDGYPVPCATCHNDSTNHYSGTGPPAVYTYDGVEHIDYKPVSIKNRSLHVNGSPSVAFDNGYQYSEWYDLSNATYNPQTKTCSNVSCHQVQTSVTWGSPYRWEDSKQCDSCHGFYGHN